MRSALAPPFRARCLAAAALLLLVAGAPPAATDGPADGGGPFDSVMPAVSASGRYVAFHSSAGNLVAGDSNATIDVFVRDRKKGVTSRASVATAPVEGDSFSEFAAISGNGRLVVFASAATNLVPLDTNDSFDIFVRDTKKGTTTRVSVADDDSEASSDCFDPALSANGRFVAFDSFSANLVDGDENATHDVFVRDLKQASTEIVSLSSEGEQGNGSSARPALSANGRFVAFSSLATNLVPDDTNAKFDLFVRDRKKGTTVRATVSTEGTQSNEGTTTPAISASGRLLAFDTAASTLVADDDNGKFDAFVRDLKLGTTTRVSVSAEGVQADDHSQTTRISAKGRHVSFTSLAENLVTGDTNDNLDVYVKNLKTGAVERVSLGEAGEEPNNMCLTPALSASGRFAAFASFADNLVGAADGNLSADLFVRDRKTGALVRESVDPEGGESGAAQP